MTSNTLNNMLDEISNHVYRTTTFPVYENCMFVISKLRSRVDYAKNEQELDDIHFHITIVAKHHKFSFK